MRAVLLIAALLAAPAYAEIAECRSATCDETAATLQRDATAPNTAPSDVGLDKLLHASLSANISFGVSELVLKLTHEPGLAWLAGMGAAAFIGLAKEFLWDLALGRGQFDGDDLMWDAFGTVGGGMAFLIVTF